MLFRSVVVAFEGEEPGDFPDDKVFLAETELMTEVGSGPRLEERGEVESAENAGVLAGSSDAGGKVLPGHRLRNRNEMGRGAGGDFLGGTEGGIGE